MRAFLMKAAPAAAAIGLMGCMANAGETGQADGPLRCDIAATSSGNMIELAGVVEADHTVNGSYVFRVVGSGGGNASSIQQGGAFAAGPAGRVTLGRIMLGGGSRYDATLTLKARGETVECSERVGGA